MENLANVTRTTPTEGSEFVYALEAAKLQSLYHFAYGLSHEINNPLAFVGNNLAVLERDLRGVMDVIDAYEANRQHLAGAEPEIARRIEDLAEKIDLPYVRDNLPRLLTRTMLFFWPFSASATSS